MATFNKFQQFVEDIAHKVHNLSADTFKVALTNTVPTATMELFSEITELAGGAGYTAGGTAPSITSSAHTTGTYKLVLGDVVFTATGAMGPFRYVVLYNDTPSSPLNPLIAWWDYGSSLNLASGDTFTVDFDAAGGVLTIA